MKLPDKITAGDTVEWTHDAYANEVGDEFLPSEWDLHYYFRKASGAVGDLVDVEGTGNDEDGWDFSHAFEEDSTPGRYDYTAKLVNIADDEIIKTIASGHFQMVGSITSGSSYDGRTQARQDLEAVQTAMRTMISGGAVQEYTIMGRQLKKMQMSELIELESKLKFDVAQAEKADKVAQGLGDPNNLYMRFRR